jgi:hypothetical protein
MGGERSRAGFIQFFLRRRRLIRNPIYSVYGFLLLLTAGYGEYSGWSLTRVNEVKNVPRSVRDNPGTYRSVYSGYSHYSGGK